MQSTAFAEDILPIPCIGNDCGLRPDLLASTFGNVTHPHAEYKMVATEADGLENNRKFQRKIWRKTDVTLRQGKGWLSKLMKLVQTIVEEMDAIREVLWRAAGNDWFEYPAGSRIHFWRFPKCYKMEARDGVRL